MVVGLSRLMMVWSVVDLFVLFGLRRLMIDFCGMLNDRFLIVV